MLGSRQGVAVAAVALAAAVGGCGANEQSTAQRRADPALVAKADRALQRLSQETLSKGPNGETAVSAKAAKGEQASIPASIKATFMASLHPPRP